MANAKIVPILPCADIDVVASFYGHLGFAATYRQLKPNPYITLARGDIDLHFASIAGFDPAQSYGSCIIGVGDAEALYRAFADGMRAAYGKVPTIGIPRFTRPQKRDGAIRSFSVVDPGGNWIRVASLKAGADDETRQSPLIRAIEAAMKVADGKGDPAQAAEVLDRALAKSADAAPADRIAALVYRAELALTLGDAEAARESLDAILGVEVTDADRSASQDDLERAEALRAKL